MNNLKLFTIIVLFFLPFAPYLMWHFRYKQLVQKLIELLTVKYPELWKLLVEKKYEHAFLNYDALNFNKSNLYILTGFTHVSFFAVGPFAQLRALKFIKEQNISNTELAELVEQMEKTMRNAILLTKAYLVIIFSVFCISLGYIYIK